MSEQTLTARWIFPVAGPPLERGTMTIAEDRIVAVEAHGCRTADVDFGNAAAVPGLVNAHTHLDLSGMRGLAPPSPDFTGWLRQVIAHRQRRTPEQVSEDIRAGLVECLQFGVTSLGDISSQGASYDVLAGGALWGTVYRELIGLTRERAVDALREAFCWHRDHSETTTCRIGLSPHAPYSARKDLLKWVSSFPEMMLTTHLAESEAELELLERNAGPFVPFLAERGAWDPTGLARDPQHIIDLACEASLVILVHCNYLSPKTAIPRNATVVYCPRTHAAFGHPPHPFRDFLARGVRVALGTDSLASNPDLDLLAEARFIHQRYPDFPGEQLLRMATLSGAEALGWHQETGSLEPGKSADLVVLPLPTEGRADPYMLLFDSALPIQSVLFRGRWVHGVPAAT